jgi:hypothetical protein
LRAAWSTVALVFLWGCQPAYAQTAPHTTAALLQRLYGLDQPPNCFTTNPSVGTSAQKLLTNRAARFEELVVNTSSADCLVLHSATVSLTYGIWLRAQGGSYSEDFRVDTVQPTFELWGICNAAGSTLTVTECIVP